MRDDQFTLKPWGTEEVVYQRGPLVIKILRISNGHRTSLQMHKEKNETMFLLSGKAAMECGLRNIEHDKQAMPSHEWIELPAGLVHRLTGIDNAEIVEVSIGGSDDDIIRYADDYGRMTKEVSNGEIAGN